MVSLAKQVLSDMASKRVLDVLMTLIDYDISISDLEPVISWHTDPRVYLGSLALGLLKVIKHGDSTSERKEPVSTLEGQMMQHCD